MNHRIIFAGTPDFAAEHLNALIKAGFKPVAVYTQPDRPAGRGKQLQPSPVKRMALEHDIDCLQPVSLRDEEAQEQLADLQPDIMIVVAYGLILPLEVLRLPRHGCINVHASLLPAWRGAAPIQRAIEAGDSETGVTIMQMDVGLDTGDMLHKTVIQISPTDTSLSIHNKLAQVGGETLVSIMPQLLDGTIMGESQDDSQATYAHKIEKSEGLIDWSDSARVIDQKIRAFTPWPGAQAILDGKTIKLNARFFSDSNSSYQAGEIAAINKEGLIIQCGEGQLEVSDIQFPGKKMTPVAALLNSRGDILKTGCAFK